MESKNQRGYITAGRGVAHQLTALRKSRIQTRDCENFHGSKKKEIGTTPEVAKIKLAAKKQAADEKSDM